MIIGSHVLLYSSDADADRAFFRDVLNFPAVDVGRGWLIFALPPAEVAVHPSDDETPEAVGDARMIPTQIYLMCDDVRATVAGLEAKGVRCGAIGDEPWGIRTSIMLPSGSELGLYQPLHPSALNLTPR